MVVVTTGLQLYFNPKDGIKTGSKLNNLAPSGISGKQANVIGGTVLANSAIAMDGIDDTVTVLTNETMFTANGSPYTMEYIFTPRQFTGDADIFDGGLYIGTFSWGNMYWEFVNNGGSTVGGQTGNTAIKSANVLYLQITYSGTTATVFINGTQVGTGSTSTHALGAGGYTTTALSPVAYGKPFKADFHALRVYNRVLSAAELTTNRAEGINIGLPVTKTKLGSFKYQGSTALIPVYDIAGNTTEKVRIKAPTATAFIETVPINDPNASNIRMKLPSGIVAWKKT